MFGRFVMWFVAAAALALGSLGGGGAAGAQTWSEYRPAGGGFRVEMPGTPTVTTDDVKINNGRIAKQTQASVRVPKKADYSVLYMDYPPDVGRGVPPEKLLEGLRSDIATHGKLRRDTALTVGGAPARDFVVAARNNLAIVMRVAWFDNRLFQVSVLGLGLDVADAPDTRRFLDSFALVKP